MNKMPKYLSIKNIYKEELHSGRYEVGDLFDSELAIIKRFNISRITARRVLSELSQEGYLQKIQGKGTFVIKIRPARPLNTILSYTEEIKMLNKTPRSEVIECITVKGNHLKNLKLDPDETLLKLTRVYYADDEAYCYTVTYLRAKFFPGIEHYNFSGTSLYHILENDYGLVITSSELVFDAVNADEKIAGFLRTKTGAAVLRFEAETYAEIGVSEELMEFFITYYSSKQASYSIRQKRQIQAL